MRGWRRPEAAGPQLGLAGVCILLVLAILVLFVAEAQAFGLEDVASRAATLAAASYQKSGGALPGDVKGLNYDQHRDIRFRPERALWRNTKLPFEIMFFHPGWVYEDVVAIHEITPEGIRDVKFDPEAFDYGKNKLDGDGLRRVAGYPGFRVHFPVNTPTYKDEILVFLGASYFRGLGRGQRFGLSARGLAIDTAESTGEEFPKFVEFWIERPSTNAKELTIYGLLDSPRAAAAYRFVVKPGITTVLDVDSRVFLRKNVAKLGLAPLTSMFLFGSNQRSPREDYRPRVHDSDGLSIQTATEWIWRPLVNPKRLLVTSFSMTNPRGFGLMQRGRSFDDYEDLEARYDLRPSAWVEFRGPWGPGRVELVQIPVPDETNDNIVAYWVPDWQPRPKEALVLSYRVMWQREREVRPPIGWVRETRRGRGYVKSSDASVELHVDFEGPTLSRMPATATVDLALSVDPNGEILERRTQRNDVTGGWRLVVRVRRIDGGKPVELRAHLRRGNEVLSETWSYILPPD